ncbi:MAG: DUF1552 domain-containing protein [Myxococcota bacterium]|nr:DUF1552 domain-containing protein [Deltaproteobacteria bacterium]MDQ3339133.1 DUF1552 domain-containing protein [Myxococcota bacterium]
MNRRGWLKGVAGAALALPFLESMRRSSAAEPTKRVYSFFIRQGNGVQQAGYNNEPERFWPRSLGTLTKDILAVTNADRALAILADHAPKLTLVRGTRFGFPGIGCGHSGGLNQVLTAANLTGEGKDTLAQGESVDYFISQKVNTPGIEPLTLMSGPQSAYIAHGLSYSGPSQLRGAKNNPFAVYTALMGVSGSPEVLQQIATRRKSVNDLVRDEMQGLLASPQLSMTDRNRLDMHFQAIRDLEVGMACTLPTDRVMSMQAMNTVYEANENRVRVADFMLELTALAFACDATRTGTLQIGQGNDGTRYTVDGVLQNTFHRISHRIDGDGDVGTPIPNADVLHHGIDKIFAGIFKRFLDRLAAYPGPSGGTLLDDSIVGWTNDLANGPPHSYANVPWVLAGGAGGFLKTGQYIDAGNITHNRLLNTIINAVGIRNGDGSFYDSFGDPSLTRGVINAMIA